MKAQARPRIIVVGAGFGGLGVARALAREEVDILLIDRYNFHTFWPLLYQIGTASLEATEIEYPVRTVFPYHEVADVVEETPPRRRAAPAEPSLLRPRPPRPEARGEAPKK